MKRWAIAGVAVCVGVTGLFFAMRANNDTSSEKEQKQTSLKVFRASDPGFSFSYDSAELSLQQVTAADKKERIVFRATEVEGAAMPFLITARYEKGLRTVASVSKMEPVDIVLDGAERSLPRRFPEFHKMSSKKFEQHGDEAAELIYTYKGPSGDRIKQKLYVLINDGDLATYITVQAKESDFGQLDEKAFKHITQTIKYE